MSNKESKGSIVLPTGWVDLILALNDAPAGELLKALCLHCKGVVSEPDNLSSRGVYRLMVLGGLHTETIPSTAELVETTASMGEQLGTHTPRERAPGKAPKQAAPQEGQA